MKPKSKNASVIIVANKQVEFITLPYKNGPEHLNANVVVKVSNGLIGKQSPEKIRILQ
jgi:hypothetical protein